MSANVEYTSKYTVNDDIIEIAVYANGTNRYVLSASNGYSVLVLLEDQLTSLVLVPIWASGGELIEDAVIVPFFAFLVRNIYLSRRFLNYASSIKEL